MVKRFKRIIISTFLITIIVTNLAFTNTRSHIEEIEQSALNIIDGKYVRCENIYETTRFIKSNIIKNYNKELDTVVIGSSHMLGIINKNKNENFLNLSIGGANLQERMNILGLLDICGLKYKKVIFEVDAETLSPNSRYMRSKYTIFNEYGDHYLRLISNYAVPVLPSLNFNDYYNENEADYSDTDIVTAYDEYNYPKDKFCYNPEVTMVFPSSFSRENINSLVSTGMINKEMIEKHYKANEDADALYRVYKIDKDSMVILEAIFANFKANNVDATIIIVPRGVHIYDTNREYDIKLFNDVEEYARMLASKYNFKIEGSFNPHIFNLDEEDFYDGFHMFPDTLNKMFLN